MLGRALAVAQTIAVAGDVAANIDQHLGLAMLAADAGAKYVVFPELSLTGYELSLASQLAFDDSDARLAPLRDLAAARAITLVVGAPVRVQAELNIGAFILSPERGVSLHTKRKLGAFTPEECPGGVAPPPEASVFTPGDLRPFICRERLIVAVGICAESLGRSHSREAAERGANTYLASHFAIPSDVALRHEAMRSYAAQHRMAIAFASYAGHTGGLRASGASAIFSPLGEKLIELDAESAGVAVAIETAQGWHTSAAACSA